jgi:hypothetical protein
MSSPYNIRASRVVSEDPTFHIYINILLKYIEFGFLHILPRTQFRPYYQVIT